ncbi:hypothetical protein SK578_0996 [Streptococcus mitis]|uniref:Uncharacterized protein n=1 Tax=Streptococcus mitis TaxID=28037 RepID=A0A081QPM7_STRMT|nr:hypothetical protein SK578_0996 [Streptococcus mitis]KYF33014.1 hypothetical protein SMI10712_00689 [Streptococcus mitis]
MISPASKSSAHKSIFRLGTGLGFRSQVSKSRSGDMKGLT